MAADESAGRGGSKGALKSLHGTRVLSVTLDNASYRPEKHAPRHDPISGHCAQEVLRHSAGGLQVGDIAGALETIGDRAQGCRMPFLSSLPVSSLHVCEKKT